MIDEILKCYVYEMNYDIFVFLYYFFRWIRYWKWDILGNWCDVREYLKIFVDFEMKIKWNILLYLWEFLLYLFY